MMMERALLPEAEKREAYGFDVMEGAVREAAPSRANVWFEVENVPVYGPGPSSALLRTEPRIMFRMRSFADPQAVFSVPKMPAHERQYPRAWAAFVQGVEDTPTGTSIDELPRVSRLTRETLRALGVRTIEEAADLPEAARQRLGMDGDRVREIARAWIKREEKGDVADIAAELAAMRAQIREREEREAQLAMELAATKQAMSMLGAKGQSAQIAAVEVDPDPDYSNLPGGDALAGDGDDDDGMEALVGGGGSKRKR